VADPAGHVIVTTAVLGPGAAETLRRYARSATLIGLDFDGVLAPIVPDRDRPRVSPETRRVLAAIARRYPCVVVSERRLDDLQPRLAGIPLRALRGNFGNEPAPLGRRPPIRVREWAETLRLRLALQDGVFVENKGFSIAVHYREAASRSRARAAIAEIACRFRGARIIDGALALSILPVRAANKGTALQELRRGLGCTRAVWVGDDDTDEDAFTSASPRRLMSIRIGRTARTGARFRLDGQADVVTLLRRLTALRPIPLGPGAGQGTD